MITLSATLLAAQKAAPFSEPRVKVRIRNTRAGVRILRFTRLYTGAETEGFHACTMPSDGSLCRARIDPADNHLYYQRVTSPGVASDYTSWTDIVECVPDTSVCLCSTGANVYLFYVPASYEAINCKVSTDYGATFGAPELPAWAGAVKVRMAAAAKSGTELCLFFAIGTTLKAIKRTSGVWGAEVDSGLIVTAWQGVGACYYGDYNLVLAYEDGTNHQRLDSIIYGDGYGQPVGNWSIAKNISLREPSEGFIYRAPYIDIPDVFRIFFVEGYTGDVATERLYWSNVPIGGDYINNLWLEPQSFNHESEYGLAICHHGYNVWLTSADGVWLASMVTTTYNYTTEVMEISQKQSPGTFASKLVVVLDNTGGTFNDFDKLGMDIQVQTGYKTSAGDEYCSQVQSFITTGWKFVSPPWYPLRAFFPKGVIGTIRIEAEDVWTLLRRWRPRQTKTWTAGDKNIMQILMYIFARVGIEFTVTSSSSIVNNFYPDFEISAGTSGLTALKKLMSYVPDQLRVKNDCIYLVNPLAADASVYTYDSIFGVSHLVYRGQYGTGAWDPNRAQVIGDTVMAEAFNFTQIDQMHDRLSRVTTPDYPTSADAAARAASELRHGEIWHGGGGWAQITVNCGQELFDVVTITDVVGGVTAIKRRVTSLELVYKRINNSYLMKLGLGLP